jgi:hypothetical protein
MLSLEEEVEDLVSDLLRRHVLLRGRGGAEEVCLFVIDRLIALGFVLVRCTTKTGEEREAHFEINEKRDWKIGSSLWKR